MVITRCVPTLAVLLISVLPSAASATSRKHSSVATYPAHGLVVSALHMSIRPSPGRRLHATVSLSVANPSSATVQRLLSVGPCRSGDTASPVCPAAATKLVVLGRHAKGNYTLDATLGLPTPGPDSVQAILARPDRRGVDMSAVDAVLLLGSRAWRGPSAGETFGIAFTPNSTQAVARTAWDLPALDPNFVYMDLLWTGLAPTSVTTSLQRCTGAQCASTPLAPSRLRSGPAAFGSRNVMQRMGAGSAAITVTAATGETLMSASLPWPK